MKNIFVLLIFFLISCGPIYETRYNYLPPNDSEGRSCVNYCLQGKSSCQMSCQNNKNTCSTISSVASMFTGSYSKDIKSKCKSKSHGGITDTKCEGSSFGVSAPKVTADCNEDYKDCIDSCNDNYNNCYTNCGGTVNPYQVCTAFCNK